MGGEGREALLDALLITDVRQHPLIDRHLAAVPGWNVQAALGHQRQQPQRFQTDSLAAGIGAGNDQCIKGAAQLNIDGHRLFRVQQRVPGFPQADGPVPPHQRPDSVHFVAQLTPGENQIQPHQRVMVPQNILPVGGSVSGQLR